jgi:hypothetical protein
LDAYNQIPATKKKPFKDMIEKFRKRIDNDDATKLFSHQLRARRQNTQETVAMYASDLWKLAKKAYPGMDETSRDSFLKDSFLFGVREDLKHDLLGKELGTFDEAIRLASSLEMRYQYLLPKKETSVSPLDPTAIAVTKEIAHLTEVIKGLQTSAPKRDEDVTESHLSALTDAVKGLQNWPRKKFT